MIEFKKGDAVIVTWKKFQYVGKYFIKSKKKNYHGIIFPSMDSSGRNLLFIKINNIKHLTALL
jgi:hypothetical protein